MENKEIPSFVLSQEITRAINNRKVLSVVFLTYQFDPGFFELSILPLLFNTSFSQVDKIKIIQLGDLIKSINIAVYYDKSGLIEDEQTAQLPYTRIALHRNTGIFHPKNIFLLVENNEDEIVTKSLISVTTSANITESGWWRNVEAAQIEEINEGETCAYREDLLYIMSQLKKEDCTGDKHSALDSVRKFLIHKVKFSRHKSKQFNRLTRYYSGKESIPEFILDNIYSDDSFNLEIISPFFELSKEATTLVKFIDAIKPKNIRIYLPKDKDGSALVDKQYFNRVKNIPLLKWGGLPTSIIRTSSKLTKESDNYRYVHAKLYRCWCKKWEIIFTGSANLTAAAYSKGTAGNFETGVIVENSASKNLDWWLSPITDDEHTKLKFKLNPERSEIIPYFVSIKFDWDSGKFSYFWKSSKEPIPSMASIIIQSVEFTTINKIKFDKWIIIENINTDKLKEHLQSTSFIQIGVPGNEPFTVLIREEGLEYKPSILFSLTVEEILQYWSLLTAEQREAFLGTKIPSGSVISGKRTGQSKQVTISSIFDKFAGIFHAFKKLEDYVVDALTNNREVDAVYRLLGKKYDSLPLLIKKVMEDKDGDIVNKYITLLCANQLIGKVCKLYPEFKHDYNSKLKNIIVSEQALQDIKDQFLFDSIDDKIKFFKWFEEMFFLEIQPPQAK